MNIGQAAEASGVSAKMIRYYEAIALIAPAPRSAAGYRRYTEADVHTLRFVRRARDLGFTVGQIAELLALWRDRSRHSADVKEIALGHVVDLRRRIAAFEDMAATVEELAARCHGDDRPDCPILVSLASSPAEAAETGSAAPHRLRKRRA
jgi:Cu(I)-responsive transcriptional regulator